MTHPPDPEFTPPEPAPRARLLPDWLSGAAARIPRRPGALAAAAFALAGILMLGIAFLSALVIEGRTERAVRLALDNAAVDWAAVEVDGLAVRLSGSAPNEAARFRAISAAGTVVDSGRIVDALDAVPARAVEAPRFSVEMLRNADRVQIIGLLPQDPGEDGVTKAALLEQAGTIAEGIEVSNMLETASYAPQPGWNAALGFGLGILRDLPSAKISVTAERVAVTAITDSEGEKRRVETRLTEAKPDGVVLVMDVTAPRPVIAPFTLRFVMDEGGARFDACAADTDAARRRILRAASTAGVADTAPCKVGLGAPTPRWAEAAEQAIAAVITLGGGSVTITDADITLEAGGGATQATLDRVVGTLETELPQVFSLQATLEAPDAGSRGPATFEASLSESGQADLSGRLVDERQRDAVNAFAKAAFGSENVKMAARLDETLPDGWPVRVLAGLAALGELTSGSLVVRPDSVSVSGVTGSQDARARIAQILSGQLGQGQSFDVDVRYDAALDPTAPPPPPEECAAKINAILTVGKISFEPGSAELAGSAMPILNDIAEALADCEGIRIEIGGHTDSQGSEGGNQSLSQARADAVLLALQGRRVDVSGMIAEGYGESRPIADNDTDAGRETNRRIEFVLIGGAPAGTATAGTGAALPDDATRPSVAPTAPDVKPKPRPTRG